MYSSQYKTAQISLSLIIIISLPGQCVCLFVIWFVQNLQKNSSKHESNVRLKDKKCITYECHKSIQLTDISMIDARLNADVNFNAHFCAIFHMNSSYICIWHITVDFIQITIRNPLKRAGSSS